MKPRSLRRPQAYRRTATCPCAALHPPEKKHVNCRPSTVAPFASLSGHFWGWQAASLHHLHCAGLRGAWTALRSPWQPPCWLFTVFAITIRRLPLASWSSLAGRHWCFLDPPCHLRPAAHSSAPVRRSGQRPLALISAANVMPVAVRAPWGPSRHCCLRPPQSKSSAVAA